MADSVPVLSKHASGQREEAVTQVGLKEVASRTFFECPVPTFCTCIVRTASGQTTLTRNIAPTTQSFETTLEFFTPVRPHTRNFSGEIENFCKLFWKPFRMIYQGAAERLQRKCLRLYQQTNTCCQICQRASVPPSPCTNVCRRW